MAGQWVKPPYLIFYIFSRFNVVYFQIRFYYPRLMAFDFKILGSSSSGNCSLFKTKKSKILIDAGFSGKRIVSMLEELGENIETIDAVFFTHEHADHAIGLKGLSHYDHLTFFANRDTAEALQKGLSRKVTWHIFETGSLFLYQD